MDFRVLGPLEVSAAGRPVVLRGSRLRALLASLLLKRNETVTVDRLVASVWDLPPASARANLRTYAHTLRRQLDTAAPGAGDRVVSTAGGYRISVADGELDLARFDTSAAEGGRLLTCGDAARAAELYVAALAEWRGRPLEDVPAGLGLASDLAWLEERYLAVREAAVDARLAVGEHQDLLGELRRLVTDHPLQERLWSRLMLAFYRSGRQGDALATYGQARRELVSAAGVEPGPELRRMHQAILDADPALDLPTVAPLVLCRPAVSGAGPAPPLVPPAPAAGSVGCQLPPAVEEFVGRTAQLEVLTGLLTGGGYGSGSGVCVAAVSGLPGGGKTAFALQAAHRSRGAFPDGQLFASLESAGGEPRDPAGVLADLLAGLGVPPAALPAGLSERAALYRARLTDRRVLVVLDDAASAAQVGWLLPGTAGCAVVAASRRRIADLPGASLVDLDPLSRPEALRLFTGIVGADRVCGQQEAAVEIVEACGRLPATLRAAAVRAAVLPALPLDWLRQRLLDRHRLDELAAGGADLRTSVHRSLRVLCPAAQRAFRRIGLLDSGEITPALVAAVLGGEDPLPAVEGLLNAGLLRFAGVDPDGLRYRMPEIIFHCARELASRDPGAEWEAAAVRHLAGMAGVLRPPLAVEGPAPLGWRPAGPAGP